MNPASSSVFPQLAIRRPGRRGLALALVGLVLPLVGLGCRNNACMTCGGGGLFSRQRPIFLDGGSVIRGGTIGESLSVPGSSGSSVISEPALDPSTTSSSSYSSATPSTKSTPTLPSRDEEIELKPLDEDETPPIPDELPSFDDLKSRSGGEPSLNPNRVNGTTSRSSSNSNSNSNSNRRPTEYRQPTASATVPSSSFRFASQRD
ncbi:hypothetical protein Isop_1851 [Isosphaera pallida ATCC 43644]|uniref:Uncharacterized protein n=1 Tax=Isosphaera pallida (strain ATCC 43644 / DSM 9630 / IS1B) TaxID=575540 RepID=E8R201_ISOPI|nr:hypothetical protein [Isosphaera pallida]ADV62433.1 hypothetical protein Isop_1851 [Isosphaera pallida ATCC 43644]